MKSSEPSVSVILSTIKSADEQSALYFAKQAENLLSGSGVTRNVPLAIEKYREAASFGSSTAQFNLGVFFAKGLRLAQDGIDLKEDQKQAVKYFLQAADQKNPEALYNLAVHYEHGRGVKRNMELALSYYRQSADLGCPNAQNNLGTLYARGLVAAKDGIDLEPNQELAVKYYQQAAAKKHPRALYNLGLHYESGLGTTTKSMQAALDCYQQAAALGNASAKARLGYFYDFGLSMDKNGVDLKQDQELAFKYFQEAAEKDNLLALGQTAIHYQRGVGTQRDMKKALAYFQRAAALGNAGAQNNLGILYDAGLSLEKDGVELKEDKKQAFEYFKQSAQQHDSAGVYNLASCFESGIGTTKNISQALILYQEADSLGHPDAKVAVAELSKTLAQSRDLTSTSRSPGSSGATSTIFSKPTTTSLNATSSEELPKQQTAKLAMSV